MLGAAAAAVVVLLVIGGFFYLSHLEPSCERAGGGGKPNTPGSQQSSPIPAARAIAAPAARATAGPGAAAGSRPGTCSDAGTGANARRTQAPAGAKRVTPKDGQCALFSKAELSQVLEVNFAHVKEDTAGCEHVATSARVDESRDSVDRGPGRPTAKEGGCDLTVPVRDTMAALLLSDQRQPFIKSSIFLN